MKGNLILLLVAAIWGTGFVAQRSGMDNLGPFTYSGVRFFFGCLSLLPLLYVYRRHHSSAQRCRAVRTGVIAGFIMFFAVSTQQVGLLYTSAGKAAFITCLYMIIVPLMEVFMHRAISRYTWAGAFFAFCGLYLLCIKEGFSIGYGDGIVFGGSFVWAVHILYIDHCVRGVDAILFAFMQFLTCAVVSLIVALATETIRLDALAAEKVPLLYGGFFPVGIAYTLQIIGQKYAKPSHAAILMSMESVFGALAGYLFLDESMTAKEGAGCALMGLGTLTAQAEELFPRKPVAKKA